MSILDILAEAARVRCEADKKQISPEEMAVLAESRKLEGFPFEKALKKSGLSFICECKKASPSKGLIEPDFNCVEIAKAYQEAGADAISILTEPTKFLGSDQYLKDSAAAVSIPILRKDFVVDVYMVDQARVLGASAVLLIAAILDDETLKTCLNRAEELGLSALCEAHDEKEIERLLKAGARIIGVNNRNLKDFTVSKDNAANLRKLIPDDILFVSESGIQSADDVNQARACNADAVLVGEALMKAEDKAEKLAELKGEK